MRRGTPRASAPLVTLALVLGCSTGDGETRRLDDDQLELPDGLPGPMHAMGPGEITPVLFVPTDQSVGTAEIDAVRAGLADVWAWYDRELSRSLLVGDLVIVYGDHDAAYYREDDGIWVYGPDELAAELGFSPWDPGHVVLLVGAGLEGWAGGSGNGGSGFAALGLESLAHTEVCAGQWWCNPDMWRGTAIHELGHALTLEHSVEPSIMSFHGDYLNKVLLDTADWPERTTVRGLPFVRQVGGKPDDHGMDGGESSGDADSGEAGDSSGGTSDDGGMMGTAGWKPDWEPCGSDGECISLRCGCNWGTELVCLPTAEYPKECS